MVYEHPQNTILVKILNGNLDLVALSREENSSMASMTQTLRLWLQLQNALNALLDSSTADDTFGITGIRQQLEKKEGLFRYGFGRHRPAAHQSSCSCYRWYRLAVHSRRFLSPIAERI